MRAAILLLLVATLAGCNRADHTLRTLDGAGYSNVHLTGYRWFACSEDDTWSDGFEATGPSGKPVSGTVCSGLLLKGSTIRLD